MKQWARKQSGFTIVELLIVVVVIAILATITIVAYNGIRDRAQTSALQSQLSQALKKVQSNAVLNSDAYPATLADAGVTDTNNITYQYTVNNSATPKEYCITATQDMTRSYYVSSVTGSTQQSGICPGHNLIVWYENIANAPPPINVVIGSAVDSTVQRNGTLSMRIGTSTIGVPLRNTPMSVTAGQIVTVNLWIKTDSNWNGVGANSKIRFGNTSGGTLLSACAYNGVKVAWTQINCPYTIPSGITQLNITLANDGTVGSIWFDDVSLSVTGP